MIHIFFCSFLFEEVPSAKANISVGTDFTNQSVRQREPLNTDAAYSLSNFYRSVSDITTVQYDFNV